MGQRQVKTVIDEEYLTESILLLHVLHVMDDLVDGPNDAPGGLINLGMRSRRGIIKATQLGQHANAKARLGVFVHIQVVQAGGGGERRGTAATVEDDLTVLAIHYTGKVMVGHALLQAVGQL